MKKRIRLSENMLNKIIRESVMEIVNGEGDESEMPVRGRSYGVPDSQLNDEKTFVEDALDRIYDALTDEQKYSLREEFRMIKLSLTLLH